MFVFGILLMALACFYGCYANPRWKSFDQAERYANGFVRALIGIPAWTALVCLMLEKWSTMLIALAVTAALLAIPFLMLHKDGYRPVKCCLLILFASLGTYARLLMAWTLIGIPVNAALKNAAEIGWSAAAAQSIKRIQASPPSDTIGEIKEIFREQEEREAKQKAEEAAREKNKKVEVWRENGLLNEYMKVNSDGTMYYDPEDGEWKKIER